MDHLRYRSYMVRIWQGGHPGGPDARARIELISRGTEVEIRGRRAEDLAARIEAAFGPDEAGDLGVSVTAADTLIRGGT